MSEAKIEIGAEVLVDVVKALRRAQVLVSLVTVRQVVEGGDDAHEAAGINPWCINEGLAEGRESIGHSYWLEAAIEKVEAAISEHA